METIQELKKEVNILQSKINNLISEEHTVEIGQLPDNYDPKSVSISKWIINISYVLFGITGIIGSLVSTFDMLKYTEFLSTFAYLWAPLVIAVGGGRAFKNYVNKKYEKGER